MNLSASDVSLAVSDPFGLWHNHHGDQQLKDRTDAYDLFLKEQGLRFEKELLSKRHLSFVNLKEDEFSSAVEQTAQLLQRSGSTIYGGALQSGRIRGELGSNLGLCYLIIFLLEVLLCPGPYALTIRTPTITLPLGETREEQFSRTTRIDLCFWKSFSPL